MKVLAAVDNTPESQTALAYVCHLLEHFDAEVHALYVRPDEPKIAADSFYAPFFSKDGLKNWINGETLEVERKVDESCEYCLAGKVPCEPVTVAGDPSEAILDTASDGSYDLIVLGSHGYSALRGFLLGTVHAKVLHHSRIPVLIVRDFKEIRRVLVAYRGSRCDQEALEFLGPLLSRKKPKIVILHVQDKEGSSETGEVCLSQGRASLGRLGHEPEVLTKEGDFVDEVLKESRSARYDLVVLGAYGNDKPRLLRMLSDHALNLVRSTTLPVLVFRKKSNS
ncbi:MAG TPA: universal stress protein [Desulfomonilaceae bacterium]|nr:universal stress protein [Desulfomonilaceae bacterium]